MGAKIIIGTSGYYYSDWAGPFYPPKMKQKDFLPFYAQHFDMTELNFTYYRQPQAAAMGRMAELTGDTFLFAVKAHCTLTHNMDTADLASESEIFIRGIDPLLQTEKLATVLFQFPYSFHYTSENRSYLDSLLKKFVQIPAATEFRNREWLRQTVYDELKDRNVTFVNVDEPQLKNLPQPSSLVTSNVGYIRFHGRNKKNWWSGDNVTRYEYLYGEKELGEWISGIKEMAESAGTILLVFNNHSKGYAVSNALQLKERLL